MTLEEIITKAQVIGKSDKTRGLFFIKLVEYFVDYQVVDTKKLGLVYGQKRIDPIAYHNTQINEQIDVKIYSPDGKNWYSDEEEARKAKKNGSAA